ncbi:DUF2358 domain-containing protein [Romeria aff. gracilis LEGE 07310]|uniref:DUF2358 domain-containing protein n=1 Tax=Vasconcelosia minhoensis LEGE 07310 TaxID=915328 RepID=A0A8J7A4B3_9CYAN|nr:DUF2358 domain-containing protein [Romeria gracilis]MBE9075947.1 DUF2358 domain-containing protein [Romeria aff. gracilis LEGE 07310]
MDIVEQLRQDYSRFPQNQSYELYTPDVKFKDPLNHFKGRDRYRQMIGFIEQWFIDTHMELHEIERPVADRITTRWTLHFTAPTFWKPRISIPGRTELRLNTQGLVEAHIDYWDCSRWDVVKQLWGG